MITPSGVHRENSGCSMSSSSSSSVAPKIERLSDPVTSDRFKDDSDDNADVIDDLEDRGYRHGVVFGGAQRHVAVVHHHTRHFSTYQNAPPKRQPRRRRRRHTFYRRPPFSFF